MARVKSKIPYDFSNVSSKTLFFLGNEKSFLFTLAPEKILVLLYVLNAIIESCDPDKFKLVKRR